MILRTPYGLLLMSFQIFHTFWVRAFVAAIFSCVAIMALSHRARSSGAKVMIWSFSASPAERP